MIYRERADHWGYGNVVGYLVRGQRRPARIAPCKRRTACSLPSTPAAIRGPRSGVRSARECTPEPVSVTDRGQSQRERSSGERHRLGQLTPGTAFMALPQCRHDGWTPETLGTPSDYTATRSMNSQKYRTGWVNTYPRRDLGAARCVSGLAAGRGDDQQRSGGGGGSRSSSR